MARFDGQVVWITGGGSGIGRACAVEFARQGAAVAVSGRRLDKLEGAVEAIQAAGGKGLAVACDVTDPATCDAAVATILAELGRLDVVVANAGFVVAGWFAKLTVEDYRRQYETNVFGLINTLKAGYEPVTENKGRFVLVSSIAGFLTPPKLSAYASSKHAVRSFGEGLAVELKSRGVSVTTVCPGFVTSEIDQVDNEGRFDPDIEVKRNRLAWTAERAARAIVKATAKRKVVVPITGHGAVLIWIVQRFPRIGRLLMEKAS